MLTKARIKYIKSLQLKKYRKEEQCFVVEGGKSVAELLHADFDIVLMAATSDYLAQHKTAIRSRNVEVFEASAKELEAAGSMQTNEAALAVARMKPDVPPKIRNNEFGLVLDDIRDPGNLGTIIRTADWYGIRNMVASPETADFYNPKTISATMGSFARVRMHYTSLPEFLDGSLPVYGTFLDGLDVHSVTFGSGGWIVVGNESHGISAPVAAKVHRRIMIPRIGGAESLNAGVATAVILDNLVRSKK